jgi:hypothetical protein
MIYSALTAICNICNFGVVVVSLLIRAMLTVFLGFAVLFFPLIGNTEPSAVD